MLVALRQELIRGIRMFSEENTHKAITMLITPFKFNVNQCENNNKNSRKYPEEQE